MNNYQVCQAKAGLALLIVLAMLLLSCGQPEPIAFNSPTTTTQLTSIDVNQISQIDLTVSSTPEQKKTPLPTSTRIPSASATSPSTPTRMNTPIPSPTPTSIPTPLPTTITLPCGNLTNLPNKVFPLQIDMTRSHNQRVAIAYPFLYLAVEQYIGVFDISEPANPQFEGFWDFPDWPAISTLLVDNGIVYFTSGSTLVMLNASLQCQLETIATMEISLEAYQLQIENNQLYLSGLLRGTERRQISIFSVDGLGQLEELSVIDLGDEPTRWAVFDETIYSLSDNFAIINISDPTNPQMQEGNLALDPEILSYSPSEYFADTLYLLWEGRYVTIISNLQAETPSRVSNPLEQLVMGDLSYFVFQVSKNYIFLGGYTCDGNSCGSYVTLFDSENAEYYSGFGFDDIVHSYYEIQPHIIYAFTSEHLMVIDISNPEEPTIVTQLELIK